MHTILKVVSNSQQAKIICKQRGQIKAIGKQVLWGVDLKTNRINVFFKFNGTRSLLDKQRTDWICFIDGESH